MPAVARTPHPPAVEEGRFLPGTLIAGRYRVIGLLGRGGMGEVYRATDLMLAQQVALKFLPESANERAMARFYDEVRLARQVSHPNVCRVYDIGTLDGQPFLSMEYIDGEDLGSLLRRIGRLPGDKAIEIARRLCAGLAAAHDKGVLHRDLKPANIMIDGRGQVRITDFGLAKLAGHVEGGEIRSGTPAYMSPEQLAGREVTPKSDIYSLGLVIYEMFTGRRIAPGSAPPSMHDVEPAVEGILQRCLEPEPRYRPASALAIAAALPGGDPLAAALAAGETPSPELVAAAGQSEGVPVRRAVAFLSTVFVLLAAVVATSGMTRPMEQMWLQNSGEALALKARDLAEKLGYSPNRAGRSHGFDIDSSFESYLRGHPDPARTRRWLADARPAFARFWYRESPRALVPSEIFSDLAPGMVSRRDPPMDVAGMYTVTLDAKGRLIEFDAVPPQLEETAPVVARSDAAALLAAASLDSASLSPADPSWVPDVAFDTRMAWSGAFPGSPDTPLRVEAAWWRGKPVSFRIIAPWTHPDRDQPFERSGGERISSIMTLALLFGMLGVSGLLAWRHVRSGRGARRAAFRLAVLVFLCDMGEWLLAGSHSATLGEAGVFSMACAWSLLQAAFIWMMYMAIEPYVRRYWPHSIISWTRLLGGGYRDATVGGDLLVGIVAGVALTLLSQVRDFASLRLGRLGDLQSIVVVRGGANFAGATLFRLVIISVGSSLIIFLLLFLVRALLRKHWAAGMVFISLGIVSAVGRVGSPEWMVYGGIFAAIDLFLLMRFGLLSLAAYLFTSTVLRILPITPDLSIWYAQHMLLGLAVIVAFAIYSFRITLADRPLWRKEV
jgi:serine/threonine-protein kinase